jgi:hypothetical protein
MVVNASESDRQEAFGYRPLEESIQLIPPVAVPELKRSEVTAATVPTSAAPSIKPASQPTQSRQPRGRIRIRLPGGVDYYPLYDQRIPHTMVPRYCPREKLWGWRAADAKYCMVCGAALPPSPRCPRCGSDLIPGRGVYCSRCRLKLPPDIAAPREFAYTLDCAAFLKLPEFQADLIEAAHSRVKVGRDERVVHIEKKHLLVHLAIRDEWRVSTVDRIHEFKRLLEDAGAGRMVEDEYELRLARQRVGLPAEEASQVQAEAIAAAEPE